MQGKGVKTLVAFGVVCIASLHARKVRENPLAFGMSYTASLGASGSAAILLQRGDQISELHNTLLAVLH